MGVVSGILRIHSFFVSARWSYWSSIAPKTHNYGVREFLTNQVSTALFHTMAVTASGDVIGCGQNDEGQIRPDLPGEAVIARPSLIEPLLSHRITQVMCPSCRETKSAFV